MKYLTKSEGLKLKKAIGELESLKKDFLNKKDKNFRDILIYTKIAESLIVLEFIQDAYTEA